MLELIKYEDNLPIAVRVLEIQHYPWHTHNDMQILYVMDGEIELKLTYSRYRLMKNNMHVIQNGDVHGIKSLSKNNLILLLSFNMDFFIRHYPDLDMQVFSIKVSEHLATYKKQLSMQASIFSILTELHNKNTGYIERVKGLSFQLIDALYKDFRSFTVNLENRTLEHQISYDALQVDRISRVISYVYQNYPYKLGLADIAAKENINNYYLSHLFQKIVGDSFRNFISMVRVEMSEAELLMTNLSISQISQNVGFSNAKYYVQNFRDWFGCHPREYRQLYCGEIAGKSAPKIRELTLANINQVLKTYSNVPVFTGASAQIKSAAFDFKKTETKQFPFSSHSFNGKKLYLDYDAHRDCINYLKKYLKDPFQKPQEPFFYDTPSCTNSLMTYNGLKKPLFWLYRFFNAQYQLIASSNCWHLMTLSDKNIRLLFFNINAENVQDFEFSFFHMSGNYQITQQKLRAGHSCLDYWKQLEFKNDLSSEEKKQIHQLSAPETSFYRIHSSDSFTYSQALEPLDIVFADIKKL